jgi:S1-C subfamily serine protease
MLEQEKRPVHMKLRKPVMSDLRQTAADAEMQAREYAATFDDGPLGTEIDSRLIVRGVTHSSQAETQGVVVGSSIITVAGMPVETILELVKALREAPKPVEMRLRKPRATVHCTLCCVLI